MGKVDIWMPMFWKDYFADTPFLDAEQHGIYLQLIGRYWISEGLPDDCEALARLVGSTAEKVEKVLDEFFIRKKGKIVNVRAEKELKKSKVRREKSQENGRKGGRPKKLTPKPRKNLQVNSRLTQTEPRKNQQGNLEKSSSSSSSSSHIEIEDKFPSETSSSPTLHEEIRKVFLDQNGGKFSNYAKEGAAIKKMIGMAQDRSPEAPDLLLKNMVAKFWDMKTNGNLFWSQKPFLPSQLLSMWDHVLEQFRDEQVQPELDDFLDRLEEAKHG